MTTATSSTSTSFEEFYSEVKRIEQRDSKLTPAEQINRLLRPGSKYFNLNPFEVLQVDADMAVEEMKKKYKRLSLLCHPDKNPDDRERAEQAFDILKKASTTIEDPDELDRCRQVVLEAKARCDIAVKDKRKLVKQVGGYVEEDDDPKKYDHAVWVMTNKIFAERERKRQTFEQRANDEKARYEEEVRKQAEKRALEKEYAKNFDESRDDRAGSWKKFKSSKDAKKVTKTSLFKPPKPQMEQRK